MDARTEYSKKDTAQLLLDLEDANSLANSYLEWANALFDGIKLAHRENQTHLAKTLAEIGEHLTEGWASHHEFEARQIREQIEILENANGKQV